MMKLIVASLKRHIGAKEILEIQHPWQVTCMTALVNAFIRHFRDTRGVLFLMDESVSDIDGSISGTQLRDRLYEDPGIRRLIDSQWLILVSHSAEHVEDPRVVAAFMKQTPLVSQLQELFQDERLCPLISSTAPGKSDKVSLDASSICAETAATVIAIKPDVSLLPDLTGYAISDVGDTVRGTCDIHTVAEAIDSTPTVTVQSRSTPCL